MDEYFIYWVCFCSGVLCGWFPVIILMRGRINGMMTVLRATADSRDSAVKIAEKALVDNIRLKNDLMSYRVLGGGSIATTK